LLIGALTASATAWSVLDDDSPSNVVPSGSTASAIESDKRAFAAPLDSVREIRVDKEGVADGLREPATVPALESYVKHEPSKKQLSTYRRVRARARSIGVTLPTTVAGTKDLWVQLDQVDASFAAELASARSLRDKRLHSVAFSKGNRERIAEPGSLQRVSRTKNADRPGSDVYLSNSDGIYRVSVLPGEDAELDRYEDEYRAKSIHFVDAVSHVLREHGAMR